MNTFETLASEWKRTASLLEEYGADEQATVFRKVATQLETTIRRYLLEPLTLEQAVGESGFSYSSLEKRLRSGELPNAGTKGSPRIRRGDLPTKGGRMKQPSGIADEMLRTRGKNAWRANAVNKEATTIILEG